MFRIRPGKASKIGRANTVPKPAMATRSTSMLGEHLGHPARERPTVESRPVSAEVLSVDELDVDTGRGGDLEGATGPVGEDERDRHLLGEHGVEDAPSTRHEHRHAHAGHATSGASGARPLLSRGP